MAGKNEKKKKKKKEETSPATRLKIQCFAFKDPCRPHPTPPPPRLHLPPPYSFHLEKLSAVVFWFARINTDVCKSFSLSLCVSVLCVYVCMYVL